MLSSVNGRDVAYCEIGAGLESECEEWAVVQGEDLMNTGPRYNIGQRATLLGEIGTCKPLWQSLSSSVISSVTGSTSSYRFILY